jgi:sugar/nucleoside kinase (ribokinase family)
MSLLVVGSVALDSVSTPSGSIQDALGGSATYFSIAASFFTKVNLVAAAGKDFPEGYLELLNSRGIDLKGLQFYEGLTFRWKGRYGHSLNEATTLSTELNVLSDFKARVPHEYKYSQYVFLANIDPCIQRSVLEQVRGIRLVACDTMNYWIENKRDELLNLLKRNIDIFILNDSEARLLSGQTSLAKAAKYIQSLGPRIVIIKKGEHGVILFSQDLTCYLPAFLLDEVNDPTGAGDSFAGGFMGYLAQIGHLSPDNLRRAIAYGSVMASFAVEDFSINRLRTLDRGKVDARFEEFKRRTYF